MKCTNFQQKSLFKLPKKLVASHVATKGYSITMCCSICSLLLQKWDASYKLQLVVTQVCKVLRKTNRSLNLGSLRGDHFLLRNDTPNLNGNINLLQIELRMRHFKSAGLSFYILLTSFCIIESCDEMFPSRTMPDHPNSSQSPHD